MAGLVFLHCSYNTEPKLKMCHLLLRHKAHEQHASGQSHASDTDLVENADSVRCLSVICSNARGQWIWCDTLKMGWGTGY